jgi:hypothetical protein
VKVRLHIVGISADRRTHEMVCRDAAMRQESADQQLERLCRERVMKNMARRVLRRHSGVAA